MTTGVDGEDQGSLEQQIEILTNELEAARIERDQARSANKVMGKALEQMSQLLHPSTGGSHQDD